MRTEKSKTSYILLLSIIIQVILFSVLYYCDVLRKSTMSVSQQDVKERTEEVKKRELKRKKKDKEERAKKKIKKDEAEKIKKDIEKKKKKKIQKKVEKIAEVLKEIKKLKEEKLEEIEERDLKDVFADKAEDIRRMTADLKETANYLSEYNDKLVKKRLAKGDKRKPQNADAAKKVSELTDKADETAQTLESIEDTDTMKDILEKIDKVEKQIRDKSKEIESHGLKQDILNKISKLKEGINESLQLADISEDELNDTSSASESDIAELDELGSEEIEVADLYQNASEMEQAVAEELAAMRAAELAMVQNTSFEEAMGKVSKNIPDNQSDMSAQLNAGEMSSFNDLDEYNNALTKALSDTERMANHSKNMLDKAKSMMPQNSQQSTKNVNRALMQKALAKSTQKQTINMSTMMKEMYSMQTGMSEGDMSKRKAAGGGEGERFVKSEKKSTKSIKINTKEIKAQALPGRKFSRNSNRQGWLYIDTWYTIGPWKNNGVVNYKVQHPPEFEIDLDQEYEGKKRTKRGPPRKLKWKFNQSNSIRVVPPDEDGNSTYYSYTEVYFEEATEVLIAVASDDSSKVWINEMLVWQDNSLSPWRMDEGFRKVFFKQGFNKILVRIENGPSHCEYSVLLCPAKK